VLKAIALRPIIQFAYFPRGRVLCFRDFAQKEERIRQGERAFGFGSLVGWREVEQALRRYQVFPEAAIDEPLRYFAGLRRQVLAAQGVC
jgi:hypothetical protein